MSRQDGRALWSSSAPRRGTRRGRLEHLADRSALASYDDWTTAHEVAHRRSPTTAPRSGGWWSRGGCGSADTPTRRRLRRERLKHGPRQSLSSRCPEGDAGNPSTSSSRLKAVHDVGDATVRQPPVLDGEALDGGIVGTSRRMTSRKSGAPTVTDKPPRVTLPSTPRRSCETSAQSLVYAPRVGYTTAACACNRGVRLAP